MRTILTYGTFDLLHVGHVNLLKRAKEMGDYLIVGLSTDDFNILKHKQSFYSYEDRKIILESVRYVDKVIPEISWEQKKDDILTYHVDTFVMGNDWKGKFDALRSFCEVVYLPRTDGISSTLIKDNLRDDS
ncbi:MULTISPECIES: glycerol-3-phosphate cytidylyltransferase [Oceanobacillus]|uniref:Glycerol-3-phosphate cytidylyltransferase n=1 Tax=Oceanobacillus aidingensis TaxID=645964 RepID=A0ABV9JUZ6_9BACI|nr:glycerol-3-phosphate cytidylyltransferase [Oceanobacillus oncorhynchi]MDM8101183.1 glycerol-3-phosphate cytidylyltransferase [Oceanobacillus oncorhynchi]